MMSMPIEEIRKLKVKERKINIIIIFYIRIFLTVNIKVIFKLKH